MKQYWLRVLGAWILLSLAGRMMKSAEAVLRAAQETTAVDPAPTPEELSDDQSYGAQNGTGDLVEGFVDARYDG